MLNRLVNKYELLIGSFSCLITSGTIVFIANDTSCPDCYGFLGFIFASISIGLAAKYVVRVLKNRSN